MLLWGLLALLVPALAYMTVTRPAALYLGAASFWLVFGLGVKAFATQLSHGALGEDGMFQDIYYVVTDRRPLIIAAVMGGFGAAIWAATAIFQANARTLAWLFGASYAGVLVFLYGAPLLLTDLGPPRLDLEATAASRISVLMGYAGATLFALGVGGSILSLRPRSR
ncbi:hypothetical protein KUV65_03075 [Maritalea mobilis]|uniref:hypothetical protein n=1 Tax=Maritalea mobilis TaxID=483324 RepID=UPI001C9680F1|nr:hypothetical protein [Maritalea mobilis]MBY6200331.1 hypothetical protein [Maritalea mobilis]